MLQAEHVTRCFKNGKNQVLAVNDVSFVLKEGELCALVGESGSGKSTLARILSGVTASDSGEVRINDRVISPKRRWKDQELCKDIQMVLQDGKSALDPRFCVYKSIAEPLRNLMKMTPDEEKNKVFALMERMDLPMELADRLPSELSGGQQKRVCIARALATQPKLIIFDEAVSGLDVLVRKKILDLIRDLHQQTGACYLMITHDLDVALSMANRILVMKNGSIVEDREFLGNINCFTHPYTRMLLERSRPVSAGVYK